MGNRVPQPFAPPRHLGIGPDGTKVNNVTDANRYDVDQTTPDLLVCLVTEDRSSVLHMVKIPNTRERPDIVMFNGEPFEVIDTTVTPPIYGRCMVLVAEEA